jgi:hypothetical protein
MSGILTGTMKEGARTSPGFETETENPGPRTMAEAGAGEARYAFSGHVFLGGCPKSGTTLFLSLLDSHPELMVFPVELSLFHRVIPKAGTRDWEKMCAYAVEQTHLSYLGTKKTPAKASTPEERIDVSKFSWEKFKTLLFRLPDSADNFPRAFLERVVEAYAQTVEPPLPPGTYRIVEKTTANDYNADRIFRWFPEAKLLQIMRDPRAVYASRRVRMVRSEGRFSKAFRFVNEWNRSVRQRERLAGDRRFFSLRYEDLVADPRFLIEKACMFIGVPFEGLPLEPSLGGGTWVGNSTYGEEFSGISSASAERWKRELSAREVWWVEFHCRHGMKALGYGLENDFSSFWRNMIRWFRRVDHESPMGYFRARRASLCWLLFPCWMTRAA